MSRNYLFAILLFFIIGGIGCRTTKTVAVGETRKISANEVMKKMNAAEVKYQTLSGKLKIKYETSEKKQAFKGSIRVIKDSAIWMSIAPAFGLEVARFLITTDSVKFIDRINNKYAIEPIEKAGTLYNVPADFKLMESLISGNLAFENIEINSLDSDSTHYFLFLENEELEIEVKVMGGNFLADGLKVQQKEANRQMFVNYEAYSEVDSQYFSHQRFLQLEAEDNVSVSLDFSRVQFNDPVNIVFVVPENYERVR